MSQAFNTIAVPATLYRVGRKPDVWGWPDWRFAGPDGTFGNRWDDPLGRYRVLYASRDRLGAYLETLSPFRPDLRTAAALKEIRENDEDAPVTARAGRMPPGWRARRLIGRGLSDGVEGPLVKVGGTRSLATLRSELAALALQCRIGDLDAAAIRLSAPRSFTQGLSRFLYEQAQSDGSPYAGIHYLSRYGDDIVNCAIFERGDSLPVTSVERSRITRDDADFRRACQLLGIRPR